jgi:hypothetical protein
MAGKITDLVAELQTALAALHAGVVFGFGAKDLDVHASPPRIVWVPTSVQHQAPEKRTTNPVAILTRRVQMVAHVWGADYDDTEAMVHNLLVRLRATAWGSIEMLGEEWIQPDNIDHGHAALVTFALSLPVHKRTYQTVQATTLEPNTTGATAADGTVEWDEP